MDKLQESTSKELASIVDSVNRNLHANAVRLTEMETKLKQMDVCLTPPTKKQTQAFSVDKSANTDPQ